MTHETLWRDFCAHCPDAPADYEAWAFGDDPDALAALVLTGVKTATASAYALYALEGEAIPCAGDHSVILDSRGEAVCVIRNTRVTVVPYCEISAGHAFREGDRSLAYWRRVHQPFFTRELAEAGLPFTSDCPVLCEEFEVVYRPQPAS